MKPRLIILSDLWGAKKNAWWGIYQEALDGNFEVQFYDSCELGAIDTTDYREEVLHQQFINGGIEKAVDNLIKLESGPVRVLAISIGGTIAWKAIGKGLQAKSLVALSATRLRYEQDKPACPIDLHYGILDAFMPSVDWFILHEISPTIHLEQGHEFYKNEGIAKMLCLRLLE